MENYLTAGDLALIENRRNYGGYGYGEGCGCGCGYHRREIFERRLTRFKIFNQIYRLIMKRSVLRDYRRPAEIIQSRRVFIIAVRPYDDNEI